MEPLHAIIIINIIICRSNFERYYLEHQAVRRWQEYQEEDGEKRCLEEKTNCKKIRYFIILYLVIFYYLLLM